MSNDKLNDGDSRDERHLAKLDKLVLWSSRLGGEAEEYQDGGTSGFITRACCKQLIYFWEQWEAVATPCTTEYPTCWQIDDDSNTE